MREKRFSYILQHEETGRFLEKIFEYDDVFNGNAKKELEDLRGYFIVAVRDCTNLFDRHGKEIYEGDIVLRDKPHVVEYCEEDAAFLLVRCIEGKLECCEFFDEQPLEVIGNIYSNPELLK